MPEEMKATVSEETNEPLGHFDFEEPSEGGRRDGWVLISAGETCLWMASLPAALIYQSYRDGTNFWLWFVAALVGMGGALAFAGTRIRREGDRTQHAGLESLILSSAGEP